MKGREFWGNKVLKGIGKFKVCLGLTLQVASAHIKDPCSKESSNIVLAVATVFFTSIHETFLFFHLC